MQQMRMLCQSHEDRWVRKRLGVRIPAELTAQPLRSVALDAELRGYRRFGGSCEQCGVLRERRQRPSTVTNAKSATVITCLPLSCLTSTEP